MNIEAQYKTRGSLQQNNGQTNSSNITSTDAVPVPYLLDLVERVNWQPNASPPTVYRPKHDIQSQLQ
jgi:hypothetical protein